MNVSPSARTGSGSDGGSGPAPPGPGQDRLDADAIEAALRALQDRYPKAPFLAVSTNGMVVDMPESVPRRENPVVKGRAALDGVPPEDHQRLIEAFDKVISHGTAECLLHPPPYGEVMWHGFDLRERHGVIIGFLAVESDPVPASSEEPERDMVRAGPPRFGTMRKDETSFITEVSGEMTEILGWAAEEMVGNRSLEFVHPDDHALSIQNWMEMIARPGPSRRIRQRLKRKDGSWVWFEVTNHNFLDDPDQHCVIGEMVDISDEMAAQEALRAREQLLNRIAETIPVGLLRIDTEGEIVYTNDRLHEIIGVERRPTLPAQLSTIVPHDYPRLEEAVSAVLETGASADIEVACRRSADEDPRFCTISFRALSHDDGTISGAIACVADITESARMREELRFRATFDELTGCHNRASIMAALDADMARDSERAVMFIDVDGFKTVNDEHGHAAGDELLKKIARVLSDSVRNDDLVGRMGGDEFLVICPQVGGADRALKLARRVAGTLHEELRRRGGQPSTVSIGVAWSRGDSSTPDALVAAADEAMYAAKRDGVGEPKLA